VSEVDRLTEFTGVYREFVRERDWEQFHTPKNLAMALAGEVGELLAEFQWLTPDQANDVMSDPEHGQRVKDEIGDVMIYLTGLAHVLGIDLVDAAREKLAKAALRYTVETHRGSVTKA
jgi:NTP pyrophosphatase (non-canonical NTP hydrolase)